MKSNWSNAAKRIMKYQFGLTLALVGSTVTKSPAQADLDEKSKVIAEWLVNFTIEILPDLTTTPQRITMPTTLQWRDALAVAPAEPADWTPITRVVPGVLIRGSFKGDHQGRFLLRLPMAWNGKLVVGGASGTRSRELRWRRRVGSGFVATRRPELRWGVAGRLETVPLILRKGP